MQLHASAVEDMRHRNAAIKSELTRVKEGHEFAVEQMNARVRQLERELFA